MTLPLPRRPLFALAALSAVIVLSACQQATTVVEPLALAPTIDPKEQECLARAMYFESNRSSQEGMLAVGSVVMNRVKSGEYSESVCGVVGQKNQFAPGVMSRDMAAGKDLAMKTAGDVLAGARHPAVADEAMFFHQAGLSFPYKNMNYVAIAGGNAFYERVDRSHEGPITSQFSLSPKS